MAQFCTKCGAALKPGNAFCTRCGAPVSAAAESVTVAPGPPTPDPNPSRAGSAAWALHLAVFCLAAWGAYALCQNLRPRAAGAVPLPVALTSGTGFESAAGPGPDLTGSLWHVFLTFVGKEEAFGYFDFQTGVAESTVPDLAVGLKDTATGNPYGVLKGDYRNRKLRFGYASDRGRVAVEAALTQNDTVMTGRMAVARRNSSGTLDAPAVYTFRAERVLAAH